LNCDKRRGQKVRKWLKDFRNVREVVHVKETRQPNVPTTDVNKANAKSIDFHKTERSPFEIYSLSWSNVCETWSLTLREERKLRVFENRTWC